MRYEKRKTKSQVKSEIELNFTKPIGKKGGKKKRFLSARSVHTQVNRFLHLGIIIILLSTTSLAENMMTNNDVL